MLLRPRTGLQDMTIELDPGHARAPAIDEGSTIPLSQTEPNVNPDQILASLDADTRDYLQLLLQAAARASAAAASELSAGPAPVRAARAATSREINGVLAKRRAQHRALDHQLRASSPRRSGAATRGWPSGSTAQSQALGGFADAGGAIAESLRELPVDAAGDAGGARPAPTSFASCSARPPRS